MIQVLDEPTLLNSDDEWGWWWTWWLWNRSCTKHLMYETGDTFVTIFIFRTLFSWMLHFYLNFIQIFSWMAIFDDFDAYLDESEIELDLLEIECEVDTIIWTWRNRSRWNDLCS